MSDIFTNSVALTGAKEGDVLYSPTGTGKSNKGLRIKIYQKIPKGKKGDIDVLFEILDPGSGKYADEMTEFVGKKINVDQLKRKWYSGSYRLFNTSSLLVEGKGPDLFFESTDSKKSKNHQTLSSENEISSSKLTYVSMVNFKSFDHITVLKLYSPTTLLIGKNNSGKSTLLEAILFLEEICNSENQMQLKLNGAKRHRHKLRNAKQIINYDTDYKQFHIGGRLNNHTIEFFYLSVDDQLNPEFDYVTLSDDETRFYTIQLNRESGNVFTLTAVYEYIQSLCNPGTRFNNTDEHGQDIRTEIEITGNSTFTSIPEIIYDLITTNTRKNLYYLNEISNIDQLPNKIKDILDFKVDQIRPSLSVRNRLMSMEATDDFSSVIRILYEYKLKPGDNRDTFIKKWIREFNLGTDYKIDFYQDIGFSISLKSEKGEWENLSDKGYGSSQLVTLIFGIVAYSNLNENKTILVVQEPETNLHPDFAANLAEVFQDAVKLFNATFIIETHSEYLVRKYQLLIAESKMNPDEISINNILSKKDARREEEMEYYHRINKIKINENGQLSDEFGKGFYDISRNLALEQYRIQRKKERGDA